MRVTTLLNKVINLPGLWVRGVRFEDDALVIFAARRFRLLSCPRCGTRVRGRFEQHRRRWRHLAIWGRETFIETPIRRLRCPKCRKVQTEAVPWARHRSAFTRHFEDAVGLLAQNLNRTAVAEMTGVSWVTVGNIAERLVAEHLHEDRFDELHCIGVDEISYRRHHKYLTVVIDHDRQRVIWAGEGKSADTLGQFFELLGPERCKQLMLISIDMSAAYQKAIREAAPQATIVFDRFHVARLAQDAVDQVRRAQVAKLDPEYRGSLKRTRWALLRRADKIGTREQATVATVKKINAPLYRAYLLKETFLNIFNCPDRRCAEQALDRWLAWACRSRLHPFVRLSRTVRQKADGILEFIDSKLTNARLEGMNNKIRLLSHRAYGFHSAAPLIATIYLCCSKIELPELQFI